MAVFLAPLKIGTLFYLAPLAPPVPAVTTPVGTVTLAASKVPKSRWVTYEGNTRVAKFEGNKRVVPFEGTKRKVVF